MRKCFIFDYDGTLAQSCQSPSKDMIDCLTMLANRCVVPVVMSGTDNPELFKLIGTMRNGLKNDAYFYLAGNSGAEIIKVYKDSDEVIFRRSLSKTQKAEIYAALSKVLMRFDLECDIGGQIIDRGSQITLSCIGRTAPSSDKAEWDPDHKKREAIAEYLKELLLDNYTVTIAGTTSVDILADSWDKGHGVKKLSELTCIDTKEMLFFGDKCSKGGNDYPATLVVDSVSVKSELDTLFYLKGYIDYAINN